MTIYTKGGDRGTTGLLTGQRVSKAARRMDAVGTVDELNALLGVALTQLPPGALHTQLTALQPDLFAIGSHLVTVPTPDRATPPLPALPAGRVQDLEQWIDEAMGACPPLTRFIMPGGSPAGATLHLARTVCRRAERAVIALQDVEAESVPAPIGVLLNRLSDYLFAAARRANYERNAPEVQWMPERHPVQPPAAGVATPSDDTASSRQRARCDQAGPAAPR